MVMPIPLCAFANRRQGRRQFRQHGRIQHERDRNVGLPPFSIQNLPDQRQVQGADEVLLTVVAQKMVAKRDALRALQDEADHRAVQAGRLVCRALPNAKVYTRDRRARQTRRRMAQGDIKVGGKVIIHQRIMAMLRQHARRLRQSGNELS
jgi:hypothetical protein